MDNKAKGLSARHPRARRSRQAKEGRAFILGKMLEAIAAAARGALRVRAARHHHQDPDRQDPRHHRPRRQGHPRHHRGDRRRDRRQRRRHGLHRVAATRAARRRSSASRRSSRTSRSASATTAASSSIQPFGAFIELIPGKDGLLHISRVAKGRVEKVEDVLNVGDEVEVEVIDIDERGKVCLDRIDKPEAPKPSSGGARPSGGERRGDRGRRAAAAPAAAAAGDRRPRTAGGATRRTGTDRHVLRQDRPRQRHHRHHRAHGHHALGRPRASGWPSAAATRRPRTRRHVALPRAHDVQGHADAHGRARSSEPSTASARSSTRSRARSTPATTRACSTSTCRRRSRSSPTWS